MRKYFAILALSALISAAPPAQAQESCGDEMVEAHWRAAVEAYQAQRYADAVTETESIVNACGADARTPFPRTLRAEIALMQNEPQIAVAMLAPLRVPAPRPLGSYPSWLYLQALEAVGDTETLAREREALIAASDRALTDPEGIGGERIESFELGGYRVSAYRLRLQHDAFLRRYYFLLAPTGAGLPRSIAITDDQMVALLEPDSREKSFAVDEYYCGGHATLDWLHVPKRGRDPLPSYEVVRAAIVRRLSGDADPVSSTTPAGHTCSFTKYITPGLDE
jgi:hypothetical protein